jgi:hypothetical protein
LRWLASAQAELGRALGGHVNVVTRSGTNLLHATAYNYLRDDRFNAGNPLQRAKLPMDQVREASADHWWPAARSTSRISSSGASTRRA